MAFDDGGFDPIVWTPSVQLRFVEVERTRDAWMQKSPPKKVLQQLWTSNTGKKKWRDVKTVKEY